MFSTLPLKNLLLIVGALLLGVVMAYTPTVVSDLIFLHQAHQAFDMQQAQIRQQQQQQAITPVSPGRVEPAKPDPKAGSAAESPPKK